MKFSYMKQVKSRDVSTRRKLADATLAVSLCTRVLNFSLSQLSPWLRPQESLKISLMEYKSAKTKISLFRSTAVHLADLISVAFFGMHGLRQYHGVSRSCRVSWSIYPGPYRTCCDFHLQGLGFLPARISSASLLEQILSMSGKGSQVVFLSEDLPGGFKSIAELTRTTVLCCNLINQAIKP